MARLPQIIISKKQIENFLDSLPKHVFTSNQLVQIFEKKRVYWNLGYSYSFSKFMEFLLDKSFLKPINLSCCTLYSWRMHNLDDIIYEIALSLKPRSYISHYSAMFLQNLTEQIPKTIYVTYERLNSLSSKKNSLTQANIDAAFQKNERSSNNTYVLGKFKIQLISSPRNDKLGISFYTLTSGIQIPVTNIERTLIDATVRPSLSGGVPEIVKAYTEALTKIQIVKLKAYLSSMNYIYPYEQAVGFYLDYVGLPEKRLKRIQSICKNEFDFYLDRKMINPLYSEKWRIYYPSYLK